MLLGASVIIKSDSFQILFSRLRPTVKLAQFKELSSISEATVAALVCTLIPLQQSDNYISRRM